MSILYDGSTDRTNAGSATALDALFATGATIMAWIDPQSAGTGSAGRIIEKTNWLFWTNNSTATDAYTFEHARATTVGRWRAPSSSISYASGFKHVAVTYDGSSTANDPLIYIDGVSQAITEMSTPAGALTDDSANSFWYGNKSGGGNNFDGRISDVRFYNRILSAKEIKTIVACHGHDGIASGLVARLPLTCGAYGAAVTAPVDVTVNGHAPGVGGTPTYDYHICSFRRHA